MTGSASGYRLWLYAAPAFALAIPAIPVTVLLPAFYAETLGFSLTAVALALGAARLIDVCCDPFVGALSDRTRTRFGRRKPWVAAGAALAGLALIQLLDPPEAPGIAHLLFWSVALYVGWSVVQIPYQSWGAEMTGGYHGRARITGAREACGIAGIVAAAAFPAAADAAGLGHEDSLAALAWAAALLGAATLPLLLAFVLEPGRPTHPPAPFSIRVLRSLAANQPFRRLVVAWLANGFATGIPAVLFPFFVIHVLRADTGAKNLLLGAYFLAALAGVPVWIALARRVGKHRAWCIAMATACAAFVFVPLLGDGDIVAFAVICLLTGVTLGADLALPPAIQADVVDYGLLRAPEAHAGLYFSLWSMATKGSLALAVAFALPATSLFGFDPNAPSQTERALFAVAVIYSLVPVVFKAIAIALVWQFPITATRLRAIRQRLDRRAQRISGERAETPWPPVQH